MPSPSPAPRPGRLRRALAAISATLGLTVVFVGATVTAVVLHLDMKPTRRLAIRITNLAFESVFTGTLRPDQLDHVSLSGVDIKSFDAVDPSGVRVVHATGIHATFDAIKTLRKIVIEGDPHIVLSTAHIEEADVVIQSKDGIFGIAETFTPKPSPLPPPPPPAHPGKPVVFAIKHIEIDHVVAHGAVVPGVNLDAHVDHVVAALKVTPTGVFVDVEQASVSERRILPFRAHGVANYHLRVGNAKDPNDLRMWMGFSGQVADVEVEAKCVIENGVMNAHADIPRARPEQIASLVPGFRPRDAVSASADLSGTIPTFAIAASAVVEGGGRVDVEGMLDATEAVRLMADAHITEVRLASFVPLDATPVTADARVRLELAEDLRVSAEVRSQPFLVQDQVVPGVDAFATYERGILDGAVDVHEEGAPTRALFSASPTDGVRFAALSDVRSLKAFPRIPGAPLDGAARVRVSGSIRKGEMDARATGSYAGVSAGDSFNVESGSFDGKVTGPLASLRVDASTTGKALHAGTYDFDTFTAHATGPIGAPHLEAKAAGERSGSVDVTGVLDTQGAGVRDVDLSIKKTGDEISGHIAKVGTSGGGVSLEGVSLEGKDVGKLEGQLRLVKGEVIGKLHGEDVDLARIAKLFGLPVRMKGLANLDVHIDAAGKGRSGHADIELENAEVGGLTGVSANLNARFDDKKVNVDGLVRIIATADSHEKADDWCDGAIAQIRLENGSAEIDGPLLDPRSWAKAYGSAKVAAEDWNLRCLARLLPVGSVLSDVKGRLGLRATIDRARGERFANLKDVLFRTRGLELAGPQPIGTDAPAWESRHVDVEFRGAFDGQSGSTQAALELVDDQPLMKIQTAATLDLQTLADRPEERWASIRKTNMSLEIEVPRRKLSALTRLPSFIADKLPPLSGEASAGFSFQGTLDKPNVAFRAKGVELSTGQSFSSTGAAAWSVPFDTEINGAYDGHKANLDIKARHGGADVASATGQLDLEIAPILAGETPAWKGSLVATLTDAPLGDVPFFVDRDVSGQLSGNVKIEGLNDRPSVSADLSIKQLKIGDDLYFDKSRIAVEIKRPHGPPAADGAPDKATARLSAELASQEGGTFTAGGHVGVVWQGGLIPTPDADASGGVDIKAQRFRLAALHPAVIGIFSKLDGFLDGSAGISWKKLADEEDAVLKGDLKVTKGVFHVPQIGQEFHDAHVTVKTFSHGLIKLEDIGADGTRGKIAGKGQVRLDGLRLKDAKVELEIKDGEDLPLTLEGVPLGNLRGKFELEAKKKDDKDKEKELDVDVKISKLHLELPPAPARGVQNLEDNPDVKVSHALHAQAEPRPPSATKMVFVVHLQDALIEGTGVRISLRGSKTSPPTATLSDDLTVAGDIHLTRGKISVFGKEFTIEETSPNLVHMQGDPTNPYLNVTARWDASDGTQVFIDYIGPLQPITADKIKLRSTPSYPPEQIMQALLLGGDFSQTQQGNTAQQAATGVAGGLGGSLAAQQFNALLSGIAPLRGFSTRFNTAQDGSLQTSVVYDISDKFSATATFDQNGGGASSTTLPGYSTQSSSTPAAVTGFGGTAAQKTSRTTLSVDWHFWRNWLLRGTVGLDADQPLSGIDFLWQYRY